MGQVHHTFANTKRYAEITEAMNKTAMRFFLWPRFPMSNTAAATGNGTPANQDRRSMHAKKSPSWLRAAHSLTCTGGQLRKPCRAQISCEIASRTALAASTKPAELSMADPKRISAFRARPGRKLPPHTTRHGRTWPLRQPRPSHLPRLAEIAFAADRANVHGQYS